jgi:uncharacterized protein YgiM (DUF1202 family)
MKRLLALLLAVVLVAGAFAQDIAPATPPATSDQVAISFPPPVYVVSDEVPIVGSAAVAGMSSYFIEFRPLVLPDPAQPTPVPDTQDTRPWFPATLPQTAPVSNNLLGTWDTATAPDGMYELRLVVNVSGQAPRFFRVSPLRVLNNPSALSPFAQQVVQPPIAPPTGNTGLLATPTPFGGVNASIQATQAAVATALAGGSTTGSGSVAPLPSGGAPFVVATTDVNVRSGDSTAYPRIGGLLAGERADVLGISDSGSGWYYVQIPNGRRGFVAPSAVRVEGATGNLARFTPPPVPVTPTPTPLPAQGDLVANPPSFSTTPTCNQKFTVFVNIANGGSGATLSPAKVTISDRHVASGTISNVSVLDIPTLAPGENYVVAAEMTVSIFFSEEHDIVVTVDSSNQVAETNENNNVTTRRYVLAQGGC